MNSTNWEEPDHTAAGSPRDPEPAPFAAEDRIECAYSFGAYLRSRAGFVFGVVALMLVAAGIMAVTSSNASSIALVSICEALFACIALVVGFSRNREFYQQLSLFCDSPDNARYLSSILDEPRTLEGSIAYRALAVQGKAASDELAARSRDMKNYRDYIELWVHEAKTPIASAQLALSSVSTVSRSLVYTHTSAAIAIALRHTVSASPSYSTSARAAASA